MSSEQSFFDLVAQKQVVRPSVRAVILSGDGQRVLVQRPSGTPGAPYAFVGGEYELGDTFESRIRAEIGEETSARLASWEYLFVVENRFMAGDRRIHALEHYLLVRIESDDVRSQEAHLVQEWLPVRDLPATDLRPTVVRDLVAGGDLRAVQHLVVDGWTA